MATRKEFLKTAGMVGLAGMVRPGAVIAQASPSRLPAATPTWADGSRLIVSVSMQFEAGGQPDNAESPFPRNMQPGFKDLPAATWYEYGYKEGIPRMLDNWDKHGIKVTSHMVGAAVLKNPALAREIVQRGHEAAAHGRDWSSQYMLSYEAEKRFIQDGVTAVKEATGVTPVGYNANWLRRGENTLKILQELGFLYHIDDLSRDEPFITTVNNRDFAVVPYTLRCNDIQLIAGQWFSTDQFLQQVKMEFDQLYEESARRRRMMSISFHDRIGGTPQLVNATSALLTYLQKHKGVVFRRKDEIAKMALEDKNTIRE
ncbi:polysaccharide deacetylase family protein [Chitinophaga nivalis]|uniref:Polysaccharide deacetylase family protein n=1 Tax=Chitinophaga nivalis TaxID=2991709 RepID=A0ABT3IX23_9BACT|nr:polysaccharide deacetylase family protein [Chitinophaga nivalis]MCW3462018.1 polysaccharide deacetylase family protein [Chitinophaga nivalis]MCW3488290.1 polysaccharide deacetylase family protein [Chitinophaga nivalis]